MILNFKQTNPSSRLTGGSGGCWKGRIRNKAGQSQSPGKIMFNNVAW